MLHWGSYVSRIRQRIICSGTGYSSRGRTRRILCLSPGTLGKLSPATWDCRSFIGSSCSGMLDSCAGCSASMEPFWFLGLDPDCVDHLCVCSGNLGNEFKRPIQKYTEENAPKRDDPMRVYAALHLDYFRNTVCVLCFIRHNAQRISVGIYGNHGFLFSSDDRQTYGDSHKPGAEKADAGGKRR